MTAYADRQLRRAKATFRVPRHEALDAPILERMERDDREATAHTEEVPSGGKGAVDGFELRVHGDANCLEGSFGGMPAPKPVRRRNGIADGVDEL